MIALGVVLLLMVVCLPVLNTFFETQPLGQAKMAAVVVASVLVFFAIEVEKWMKRRRGE